ncbi:alpha/beta fold hydrolase [Mycobacterium intracellulare]|uniref:alpha/beta fold hydrolase n=1 Tax=Mycobacterium intracellulare TaxID=1767 RepID=UPI002351F4A0|nr:alpha/beta hydrolase [Mycobacterium intracellulare]
MVLMHTVRTQLDHFQRLIPLLTGRYRVFAVDFPGMGWSDIVRGASYGHDDLVASIVEFVRGLDLTDTTLAGESMGAVVALTASVELGKRVTRVVASNTYDYPQGLERANVLARIIIPSVRAPIIGPVFAAMENKAIVKGIVSGGYADPSRFPSSYLDELVRVGARPGYSQVARAIYRNLPTLIAAHDRYPSVTVPATLIYTTKDWSRKEDREKTAAAVPTASVVIIDNAGHFCAMEKPEEFAKVVLAH